MGGSPISKINRNKCDIFGDSSSNDQNESELNPNMTESPTVEQRLSSLESSTVPVDAAAGTTRSRVILTAVFPTLALLISALALIVPLAVQKSSEEANSSTEQRAAIGPLLNNVSLAEKQLWDAKKELSYSKTAAPEDAKSRIANLQAEYLNATYQVVPHADGVELNKMNRLTQSVLSSGYVPGADNSDVHITSEQDSDHSDRRRDFQLTFRCAVNVTERSQCGDS